MADPRPPTRKELAKFLPDQRTIRAFEQLFKLIPDDLERIDEAMNEAVNASSKANDNASKLTRIIEMLELLASEPKPQEKISRDYIDFNTHPKADMKEGRQWWNYADNTLNIGHGDDVVQQVGQETYMRVKNDTGSTINNGEVVGFSGVNGRVTVAPYTANTSANELYFVGVATQDIVDQDEGMITLYGTVRGIDTSSYSVGDILYSSTTTAGGFTNVRPTAPNVVIPVATVLASAVSGEIMVRPVIPMGLDYAAYNSTVDQTLAASNTAYPVTFNSTQIENGISLVSNSQVTASYAGLYMLNFSLQVISSTSSTQTAYAWLRKNGTDIPNTRFDFTIKANGDTKLLTANYKVSLAIGDYIQVMWAGSSTNLKLDYNAATAFAPASASASIEVTQVQL